MNKIVKCVLFKLSLMMILPVFAKNHMSTQSLVVDQQPLLVNETSGQILGNNEGHYQLVEDLTDGLEAKKIAGYKIMVVTRASSSLHMAKQNADGSWRDNRYVHRGIKVVFGVPVVNGKIQVNQAILLNMAVIDDSKPTQIFTKNDKVRPRGQQMIKKASQLSHIQFQVNGLILPHERQENTLGHINYTLSAMVDGNTIAAKINAPMMPFEIAKPNWQNKFSSDSRFIKNK